MKQFPSDIKFKFPWRRYQQRVLHELDQHLENDHLHVVAPPGSGKTVLGLEVMLRLNRPAIIFTPALAIKEQWIHRFRDLFLQGGTLPGWISDNIYEPAFLTVTTYQALHAAVTGAAVENEEEAEEEVHLSEHSARETALDVITRLKDLGVATMVLDEAHHLKNAWWRSLMDLKNELSPKVIALTATPPYDVSYTEWQRYLQLNGPVDTEITVPELVAEGDLCPHQDYVYMSMPAEDESEVIFGHRRKVMYLYGEIRNDPALKEALQLHPVWLDPKENREWIFHNSDKYLSLLVFLHDAGVVIGKDHLDILHRNEVEIPDISYKWLGVLLTFYLMDTSGAFVGYEVHRKDLSRLLAKNSLLENGKISFGYGRRINRALVASRSKMRSICEIVNFEGANLGDELRMVILTDYIRAEYLVKGGVNNSAPDRIGVVPIFEMLRRARLQEVKLGVLSGSLVIIPAAAQPVLTELAGESTLTYQSLPYDNGYVVVSGGKTGGKLVGLITRLFQLGEITVLTGTKSLLGEGWDAPSVNTLVLATVVGSYVLSNQMRGRAIRSQHSNSNKTGNIWHLVCVNPDDEDGGEDLAVLKRRFRSFVGTCFTGETGIENGIGRMSLPEGSISAELREKINRNMLKMAGNRTLIRENWETALQEGVSVTEEIRIPKEHPGYRDAPLKKFYYEKTRKNRNRALLLLFTEFLLGILQSVPDIAETVEHADDVIFWLILLVFGGILTFGLRAYRAFRLYLTYRDISKDIIPIGRALVAALRAEGSMESENVEIKCRQNSEGILCCYLVGGNAYEHTTFVNALSEIVNLPESCRYIIVRKSKLLNTLEQRDYHAVPEILGRRKKLAEYFKAEWEKECGDCDLIYTRTDEGKKLLLTARLKNLSRTGYTGVEMVKKWV